MFYGYLYLCKYLMIIEVLFDCILQLCKAGLTEKPGFTHTTRERAFPSKLVGKVWAMASDDFGGQS